MIDRIADAELTDLSDVLRLANSLDLKISEQANVIVELTKVIEQLKEQNKKLEEKVKRLETLLAARLDAGSSKKPDFPENYSLERDQLNGTQFPALLRCRKPR